MTSYSPWNKCKRCDRCELRWGIYAPSAKAPRVLVLGAAASRASQAVGDPDPGPLLIARSILEQYKLRSRDVHVDNLLACGPTADADAHHVAACVQRLDDQAVFENWPLELVVLVGDHAARLARDAGYLRASGFRLGGRDRPSVIVREFWDVGVDPVWRALGSAQPSPPAKPLQAAATVLREIVKGRCSGHAWRLFGREWRRVAEPPPDELFDLHVAGHGWLAPFRPVGPWPYCVLDVDLHNALQYARHDDVAKKLTELFPKSLFFTSSVGRGLHVYIRLPENTAYADAAVWLAEFLLVHGLLVEGQSTGPYATTRGAVATRLVEVPPHPPRLPFGLGSRLRGHPDPAKALASFERWLSATDYSDFEHAREDIEKKRKKRAARWPERAAWVTSYVSELELEALKLPRSTKKLPESDPWERLLPRLAPSVAVLATNGCIAFGTRTTTMMRLANALAELVEPDEARSLLRYWVEERVHNSEDIQTAREHVLEFGDRLIADAFADRGIPTSVWDAAENNIRQMYRDVATHLALEEEECLRAAFHILRLFYSQRTGYTFIGAEQFGLALERDDVGGLPVQRPNRNRVDDVRGALVRAGLIRCVREPRYLEHRAGEYELKSPYWPPPPSGTPVRFQPP